MTGHNLQVRSGPVDILVDLDDPVTAAYVASGIGPRTIVQIDVVLGGKRATLNVSLAEPKGGGVDALVVALNETIQSGRRVKLRPWAPRDDMSAPPAV